MFAVCHIKRCAEYRMAMTVPSSAHLFHFPSLSDLRQSQVFVASFLPILISCQAVCLLSV